MTPIRRKSLLIIGTMIAILVLVSFFGTVASFERSVYISAIAQAISDRDTESDYPLPTFISRPYQCESAVIYVDRPADPILDTIKSANKQSTRPIPLAAASHLVPVMSWEDSFQIFRAGYLGLGETDLVFVSRVGFDRYYNRATVCLTRTHSPHGWGEILTLERTGLDWSVVWTQRSKLVY